MDYDQTEQVLNSFVGRPALVYPVSDDQTDLHFGGGTLGMWGTLTKTQDSAEILRMLSVSGFFERTGKPKFDLGDAPLEQYELQRAIYGFEGMNDLEKRHAGFTIERDGFIESEFLDFTGGEYTRWLLVRTRPVNFVVAGSDS